MTKSNRSHHDGRDIEHLKKSGTTEGHQPEIDQAGTDPNRYRSMATGNSHDESGDNEYDKEPKNHTTTDERMINPDRGE